MAGSEGYDAVIVGARCAGAPLAATLAGAGARVVLVDHKPQGISDAIEQALFVAEALNGGERRLEDYEAWRDERAAEHYEWSFDFGSFPKPGRAEPLFAGLASDPEAAQALRDTSTRRTRPRSDVFTKERLAKWFAGAQAPA